LLLVRQGLLFHPDHLSGPASWLNHPIGQSQFSAAFHGQPICSFSASGSGFHRS